MHGTLALGCDNGHRFDVNKRGYLSTIDKSRGIAGDSKQILQARAQFLALGHYEPIAELIEECLPPSPSSADIADGEPHQRILDSGCGTGYYLAHLLAARPGAKALALDAATDAVAMTVAATSGAASPAAGLVADVWQPSAVRDDAADVVLCVFAPRNTAEFARVLAPGGRLVVVTPRQDHLEQLRATGEMIGIQPGKLAALDAGLSDSFGLVDRQSLIYSRELDLAARTLVAAMGPSGHHHREAPTCGGTITIAVDISVYAHQA